MILVCGATGLVGSRVGSKFAARSIPFRALLRGTSDASALERGGAEIVRGDLRDPRSLEPAVAGVETIVSTASAFFRLSAGARDLSFEDVDRDGYLHLIDAAERAGVQRFVYLSLASRLLAVRTPLSEAKLLVQQRLRASPMHEVIVASDLYQETSLSPQARFDWTRRSVAIPGRGDARIAYVAVDDVAELLVRLAMEADPPRYLDVGGPEPISRTEAAALLERLVRSPVRRSRVPRVVLRAVAAFLRGPRPALSSEFGLVLAADLADTISTDAPLRDRGIEPRPVVNYLQEVAGPFAQLAPFAPPG